MQINTLNSADSDPYSFKNIYQMGIKIYNTGPFSIICQIVGVSGIRLQGLNRKLYKKVAEFFYAYEIRCFRLNYKQLVHARDLYQGVNEKTYPAKPSPDNPVVAFEHDGYYGFNIILQDGTRSDNPFTLYGDV